MSSTAPDTRSAGPAARRWHRAIVLTSVLLASLILGCTEKPNDIREPAGGASIFRIETEDGVSLSARLWANHTERVIIYLHEYRETQASWWPFARQRRGTTASAFTIDFRGHGESEGEAGDVAGMLHDVRAAIGFLRARGYSQIMLVGAGMGGAIATVAAAEDPAVTAIGLSVPSEFDTFRPVDAARGSKDRLAFLASRDDLSAAYSLSQFRDVAGLNPWRVFEYPGKSHGVDMLSGRAGADVRAQFERLLTTLWQQQATAASE